MHLLFIFWNLGPRHSRVTFTYHKNCAIHITRTGSPYFHFHAVKCVILKVLFCSLLKVSLIVWNCRIERPSIRFALVHTHLNQFSATSPTTRLRHGRSFQWSKIAVRHFINITTNKLITRLQLFTYPSFSLWRNLGHPLSAWYVISSTGRRSWRHKLRNTHE